jgi:Ni,Fe-hydrogenase III component G
MHDHYIESMDKRIISEEVTFLWLSRGDLKVQSESEIIAAQDQTLQTKYHAIKVLQTETDSKCRLGKQFDETVDHISVPNISKRTTNKET